MRNFIAHLEIFYFIGLYQFKDEIYEIIDQREVTELRPLQPKNFALEEKAGIDALLSTVSDIEQKRGR
ncbi:hypothetical protein HYZ97_03285 [Candidatus Pacearchaeota archaeon]|nr:hypothetical protein [Candidatus Pacearchaeota archaeon]